MRDELTFTSGGARCAAWLYRGGADRRPCVVMGHGFGGTREDGLAPFAERFAAAGFHVLVFDYRCFGDSDGEPRQLLSIRMQLDDWAAAIAHARALPECDGRVALWGTSFSGGHVVVAGARDGRVAAVIAQCPMMDGRAALRRIAEYAGLRQILRVAGHGLYDAALGALGGSPHRVAIVGPPGSIAAMTTPEAEPGYLRIAGPHSRNEVCARIGLATAGYRPLRHIAALRCPILIQICEKDSVAPAAAAEEAARRAGSLAEVVRYPVAHFDVYVGADFERSIGDQLAFLERHLRAAAVTSSPAA